MIKKIMIKNIMIRCTSCEACTRLRNFLSNFKPEIKWISDESIDDENVWQHIYSFNKGRTVICIDEDGRVAYGTSTTIYYHPEYKLYSNVEDFISEFNVRINKEHVVVIDSTIIKLNKFNGMFYNRNEKKLTVYYNNGTNLISYMKGETFKKLSDFIENTKEYNVDIIEQYKN